MRTKANSICICDANAFWNYVVDHARELIY